MHKLSPCLHKDRPMVQCHQSTLKLDLDQIFLSREWLFRRYYQLSAKYGRNMSSTDYLIDQFRYIRIQPKTMDLSTRLWGINPTNSVFIPQSLVLRSIVLA